MFINLLVIALLIYFIYKELKFFTKYLDKYFAEKLVDDLDESLDKIRDKKEDEKKLYVSIVKVFSVVIGFIKFLISLYAVSVIKYKWLFGMAVIYFVCYLIGISQLSTLDMFDDEALIKRLKRNRVVSFIESLYTIVYFGLVVIFYFLQIKF